MKRLAVILCLLTTGILNGHAQQFSNLVTDPASIAKLDLVSYIEEHELQDLRDLYMVLISIDDATDVITFNLTLFYAEDETPVTLTLNFARNE